MPTTDDITWFKQQFQSKIDAATQGTPFNTNMLAAIACQETGEHWPVLRRRQLSQEKILELCVGDTLDQNAGRSVFPRTKSELLAWPNGDAMFAIARQALLDMSQYIPGYQRVAQNQNKFCHGFGIFQYDLQFFKTDPGFFLNKQYADFDACVAKCITELKAAMKRNGWQNKTSLTDLEMAGVAIAYNKGSYKKNGSLQQGHRSANGRFYGENFFDYLRLAKRVEISADNIVSVSNSLNGEAVISQPTPVEATGDFFEVDVVSDPLRLRSEPRADKNNPNANVLTRLPDGHVVRAVSGKVVNGFLEVETSFAGAHYRGFASASYLKASSVNTIVIENPKPDAPQTGIVAVYMPRKQATITKRSELANAFSLNEPNQPGRKGSSAEELRNELAAIINWLAVDKPTHRRFQPRDGLTFCNMYAHDYCFLAGVYLPRVWWTPSAIVKLSRGETVQPLLGNTIDEIRANGLFRWLRDFGLEFGWRQTGTLTKLQTEVNQGAVGLIVARRKEDGKSGHIVPVVPETSGFVARRNTAGEVIAPLQSQAGATNFRYGTNRIDWWKGDQFAESAFWIHA